MKTLSETRFIPLSEMRASPILPYGYPPIKLWSGNLKISQIYGIYIACFSPKCQVKMACLVNDQNLSLIYDLQAICVTCDIYDIHISIKYYCGLKQVVLSRVSISTTSGQTQPHNFKFICVLIWKLTNEGTILIVTNFVFFLQIRPSDLSASSITSGADTSPDKSLSSDEEEPLLISKYIRSKSVEQSVLYILPFLNIYAA